MQLNFLNDNNITYTIGLEDPDTNGVLIYSIEGLDNISNELGTEKSVYNSVIVSNRPNPRYLKISLMFEKNPVTNRRFFNTLFTVGKNVHLSITEDGKVFKIDGTVESIDFDMFSSAVVYGISIICPDQRVYGNEVIVDNATGVTLLDYDGTIDTGLIFIISLLSRPLETIQISNTSNSQTMTISRSAIEGILGRELASGDVIKLDTTAGNKSITLNTVLNILSSLDLSSSWITLAYGTCRIVTTIGSAGTVHISYFPAYGGI